MSTDYHDLKVIAAEWRRENTAECDHCGVPLGVGPGKAPKARGVINKDFPGEVACLECAESIYGDHNVDDEPMADDETQAERSEQAEQAQLENYAGMLAYGGGQ